MKLKRMLIVLLVAVMVLSNVTGILGITKVKEAEAVGRCLRTDPHWTGECSPAYDGNTTWSVSVATSYTIGLNATRTKGTYANGYPRYYVSCSFNIAGGFEGRSNSSSTDPAVKLPTNGYTTSGSCAVGTNSDGKSMVVKSITVPSTALDALNTKLGSSLNTKVIVDLGSCPNKSGTTGNVYHQHNADGSDSYYYYWDSKNPTSQGTMGGYTVAAFTLTYDGNKPNVNAADVTNVPEAVGVNKNTATAISATIPVCEGYVFTGWNTNANGTGTAYSPGASISMTEDVTLYAQWTPGICSLTYVENLSDALGLTGMPSPNPQTATTETNVTVSTNVPTSTNYWFLGWNTVANPTTENPGTVYAAGTIWRNACIAETELI